MLVQVLLVPARSFSSLEITKLILHGCMVERLASLGSGV